MAGEKLVPDRSADDLDVEPQRPTFDIFQIVVDARNRRFGDRGASPVNASRIVSSGSDGL
jgi:hypothetical protein